MFIDEETKEKIKSGNNIVDIIGEVVNLKRKGRLYWGLCPFHGEKTPSFTVSEDSQSFYCYGCHQGGDVIKFIEEYEGMEFFDAISYLANRVGIELNATKIQPDKRYLDRKKTYEMYRDTAIYFHNILKLPNMQQGIEYFHNRGLSDETINSFGLGYAPSGPKNLYSYLLAKGYEEELLAKSGLFIYTDTGKIYDKFYNRVMFPIVDVQGKIIAFGGRIIGAGEPKYLNSPETDYFKKRDNLFNLNQAKRYAKNFLVLCEGYMDVIALFDAGIKNAVASLGTALTINQVRLIKKYVNQIILVYDSDKAGIAAMEKAFELVRPEGLSIKAVILDPYKDPDELVRNAGAEEMQFRIDNAENIYYFLIDNKKKNMDMSDPDNLIGLQDYASSLLIKMDNADIREYYIKACAERYGFDEKIFRRRIGGIGEKIRHIEANEQINNEKKQLNNYSKDSYSSAEVLLITLFCRHPMLYQGLSSVITSYDFRNSPIKNIAEQILEILKSGNIPKYSDLKIDYENSAEQSITARIFAPEYDTVDKEELGQLLKELILKVKQNSLKALTEEISQCVGTDSSKSSELSQRRLIIRKEIDKLTKLQFSFK